MTEAGKQLKNLRYDLSESRTKFLAIDFDGASFDAGREFQHALNRFDYAMADLDDLIKWAERLVKK